MVIKPKFLKLKLQSESQPTSSLKIDIAYPLKFQILEVMKKLERNLPANLFNSKGGEFYESLEILTN